MSWIVAALLAGCTPEAEVAPPALVGGPGLSLTFVGDAPRNVVVYTVDTMRRDRLPWYDSPHDTVPGLTDRAANVVAVDQAYTVGSWTVPSTAAQFSGLDAPRTEMVTGSDGVLQNGATLPAGTVAEMFKRAGYATALITGNPIVSEEHGFWQGVDYGDVWLGDGPNSYGVVAAAEAWVAGLREDQSFYLHLQPMDAHHPFDGTEFTGTFVDPDELPFELDAPGEQTGPARLALDALDGDLAGQEAMVARIRSTYDEEVLQVDHALGSLLSALELAGRLDDTLVVFTADHGESLADGTTGAWRFGHSRTVFPELVHIPLAFYNPRLVGGRIEDCLVQNVDWMPTVASLVGVPLLAGDIDGRDMTQGCRPWGVSSTYRWSNIKSESSIEFAVAYDGRSAVRATCSEAAYTYAAYDHGTDPNEASPRTVGDVAHGNELHDILAVYLAEAAALWDGAACR